ncbi:IclR family transcriptional regulator [Bifidobacterium tibiigranuli]|jgi:DNA-binding IclR family transcriptional regulator|uniref:IclR family transcriptional regulator n=1 Tax=Bifidobacterium tibiigranuli TaxID=2172043 RepID=UPI0026EEB961|nr:IclR family transcriptional regulator C-terminal domain-containing protein [Bifidobacterium tibiigranuli]MCI1223713.1 hypothetical protein [Bifidobacterium subtile]MCI1650159.1 hypothetical protein [Bifidobacterium tibiigranuli]MCI2184766.1 hypothetical protein [Bifidobacterium tibiigranuli]MCI2204546.1 hypothetical protein [Bifidobacterium tibiigranuli]
MFLLHSLLNESAKYNKKMMNRTSMGRGMEVLQALAAASRTSESPWKVSQLARCMGRERSQVSRVLSRSASSGIVEVNRQGYRLCVSTYATAQALTEQRLRGDGLTVLEQLSRTVGESCFLGELYADSTITVVECIAGNTDLFASWLGRAYPAFNSDAGQATLWDASDEEIRDVFSHTQFGNGGPRAAKDVEEFIERLKKARERGYAIIDEEAEAGLLSVAAPVFDFRGENIAALQIVGERTRLADRISLLGESCAHAAAELSSLLGWVAAPTGDVPQPVRK